MDDLANLAPKASICDLAIGVIVRYHLDRENARNRLKSGINFVRLTENSGF